MTESVNTSIGRSADITKPHTIKTGMNINQNLLLIQIAPQSLGISQCIQIQKIDANKPDITIKDHKRNSYLLVELMSPMDKNLSSA